ncbi:uncharacterized protein LOC135335784 [Halichondria panicea]|uniref:uncharacterized protein LOC135335784 n=1 Tax=Halichondria panicea TaxID=6063 RepID=UPI00312B3532
MSFLMSCRNVYGLDLKLATRVAEPEMDTLVEPPPCSSLFSAKTDKCHYVWRGLCSRLGSNIIAVFDPSTEQWSLKPTTGPQPPGEWSGCSVCVGHYLHIFGGHDGNDFVNDMYKLDLDTFHWTKARSSGSRPIKKNGCGLVCLNKITLGCFGGFGIEGPTQPGSTFTSNGQPDRSGRTNEFHLFDVRNGVWSSPELRGKRPPPCADFSFTMVDQNRAVLFGGTQPGRDCYANDVYLFDFRSMVVTKVEPVQGEPWPVERSVHAACCLNYGKDQPQLLIHGGLGKGNKVLGDMWILDVDAGKWTKGTPPESVKPRRGHSTTTANLGPGLTEVLMFGGCLENHKPVAETTILRFELTGPSASVAGPSTGKWTLVDVAHNDTRGSAQRLSEKMIKIRQAIARSSSVHEASDHSSQDQVETLKQQLQEKDRQLAEANQRDADLSAQITALVRELEGKTKELAAHNTEVWRIPANRVNTLRTIGTGGWGEVLEGTVSVAVKRLFAAIVSPRNLERLQREMRLLAEVRHPNLVHFIGAVFDQSPPLIITELLDMNLRQAYETNQLVPKNRLSIFIDIAQALDYLHQRYEPIIHRDVSAPNVLLQQMPNHHWKGKVSDLGSANFLQQAQTKGEGCILYSAPEVIPRAYNPRRERVPQTTKIDVYSYGVLLCEVITKTFPSEENYWGMLEEVERDYPQFHNLINNCTQESPDNRPTMIQVLNLLENDKMPKI